MQVFKTAELSGFWDGFCVIYHVWSHLVYYFFFFLHLDDVYYDESGHLHLFALQAIFCFLVNKFSVWRLKWQALLEHTSTVLTVNLA